MKNTIHNQLITREDLRAISGKHQARVEPLWSALRAGCGILLLKQNGLPFDPPVGTGGALIIVEDDTRDGSHGPDGFDGDSLRHLSPGVDTLAILTRGATSEAYTAAAQEAMRDEWALVLETSPEHERAWLLAVLMAAFGTTLEPDPRNRFRRIVQ